MSRIALTFLAALILTGKAPAALDPEADKPYHLQVILLVAEHRVFTPVFREQVERELRDNLQTALGSLARVTLARDHPLSEEIRSKGLLKVLDSVRLVSDTKTHFVLLDFASGQYALESRQYDGPTGMASAIVRRQLIGDRQLVGRTAALMVEQDFGIVGTLPDAISSPQQGQKLTLTLRGGQLRVPLQRWVKKGDVFAITQLNEGAAGPRAFLVPGAVLQVIEEPRDGSCLCQLWYRYSPALPSGRGVLGYRCLKLSTTASRVRLRMVPSEKTREPLHALSVSLSPSPSSALTTDTHATNLSEPLQSRHPYSHLVFVTVFKQSVRLAGPFPLPVLGDAPVSCLVGATQEADRRGPLESRARTLARSVSDSLLVHANLVTEFNKLSEQAPEAALKNARAGLGQMRGDLLQQNSELAALRAEAGKVGLGLERELGEIGQRLQELRGWQDKLEKHLADLSEVLTKQKDPLLKVWQARIERAHSLASELDFEQALALYEKVLAEAPNVSKELRERVAKLKRDWQLRDDEHRAARGFIYQTWPKLTEAARIREQLPEAWKAYRVCRDAGDLLTPQKLLRASKELGARLRKELDGLRPEASDDDRRAAETIEEVTTELVKLIREVSSAVEKP